MFVISLYHLRYRKYEQAVTKRTNGTASSQPRTSLPKMGHVVVPSWNPPVRMHVTNAPRKVKSLKNYFSLNVTTSACVPEAVEKRVALMPKRRTRAFLTALEWSLCPLITMCARG